MNTNIDPDPFRDPKNPNPPPTPPPEPDEPKEESKWSNLGRKILNGGAKSSPSPISVVTQMAYRDGVRDAITILSLGVLTGLLAHKLWKIEL